jgi:hypothetical protein
VAAGHCWKKLAQSIVVAMTEALEAMERRIVQLRTDLRRAVAAGDRVQGRTLRAELRRAEHAWEEAIDDLEARTATAPDGVAAAVGPVTTVGVGPLLPLREQVHQALTLLSVPAAPKMIIAVHEAFSGSHILGARLTSLRRDEERSFRTAPFARPYYICGALTYDMLSPARGLLAVSTWPMTQRIITPLSPRVDFLTAAIHVADQIARLPQAREAARRLLWGFAANIPGAADSIADMEPAGVSRAAQAELEIHASADRAQRQAAAGRARRQLDDAQQLFGAAGMRRAAAST